MPSFSPSCESRRPTPTRTYFGQLMPACFMGRIQPGDLGKCKESRARVAAGAWANTIARGMGIASATVVITTKNRKEELRTAIRSALDQTARPQVLVIDDGSSDGTSEMVRSEFRDVTLHRYEQSNGLIVQRNNGAKLAG